MPRLNLMTSVLTQNIVPTIKSVAIMNFLCKLTTLNSNISIPKNARNNSINPYFLWANRIHCQYVCHVLWMKHCMPEITVLWQIYSKSKFRSIKKSSLYLVAKKTTQSVTNYCNKKDNFSWRKIEISPCKFATRFTNKLIMIFVYQRKFDFGKEWWCIL